MEYISVNEAAVKWGVHIRIVQGYCKDGRIFGARKFGRSWMIPADTDKPDDPRRFSKAVPAEKTTEISFKTPLPVFTMLYRSPGSGEDLPCRNP